MHAADDSPNGFVYDAADQLRHDLKTPLTTIHARAQLLERAIRRSPTLADEERVQMLAEIAMIETAVHQMIPVIDAVGRKEQRPQSSSRRP
jgi:signal transduction histidine kinase